MRDQIIAIQKSSKLSKIMNDDSDDYEFIEERLITNVKYRFKQMQALQDEEIERLKTLLHQKRKIINQHREDNSKIIAKFLQRKTQLITKLSTLQNEKNKTIKTENEKFQNELKILKEKHSKNVEEVNKHATVKMNKNYDFTLDHEITELKQKISTIQGSNISEFQVLTSTVQIQSDKNERELKNIESYIENRKKLADKLERQLNSIREKSVQQKILYNSQLDSLNQKLNTISNLEMQNSTMIIPEYSCDDLRLKYKQKLKKIKNQISSQRAMIKQMKFKSQTTSVENTIINDLLRQEKSQKIIKDEIQKLKDTIREAEQRNNDLKSQISQLDPVLQKLRNRHYLLLSAIKATDYKLNGRNGQYQRSTQISATQIDLSISQSK